MLKVIQCVSLVALLMVTALPAYADYFDTRRMVSQRAFGNEYGDTLVKFGGCEEGVCSTSADDDYHNVMWVIGELGTHQGIYWLPASDNHDHGRLKLKYDYKIVSEERRSDSVDYARIRIKDVDTDTIIYEKVWTPAKASGWRTKVISLPGNNATKNLQLVFESNNDSSGLTQLYVRNWRLEHKSEPQINGVITYKVNGETRYATNALVALQNKSRTQTYTYTRTNSRGEYTFFPIDSNQRYVLAATLGEYDGLNSTDAKVKNGQEHVVNLRLTKN